MIKLTLVTMSVVFCCKGNKNLLFYSRLLDNIQQSQLLPLMDMLLLTTLESIQISDTEPFTKDLNSVNIKAVLVN